MILRLFLFVIALAAPLRAEPVIGIAFPPVRDADQMAFSLEALGALDIGHVRIAEAWERRGLTPSEADFEPLLRRLQALEAAGIDTLLSVELRAPEAACGLSNEHACVIRDDAPFEAYLTILLRVAGPHIDAIQIGNEWDTRFPGTTRDFMAIHDRAASVIRAERPDLTLVLGGISGRAGLSHALCFVGAHPEIPGIDWAQMRHRFCLRGAPRNEATQAAVAAVLALADYDVVDLHLYDAPGLWPEAVGWLRSHSAAPIWVTEFGGPSQDYEPQDPDYQATRIRAYLDVIATLPIARAYYFKLTDDPNSYHAHSGLYDIDGQPKPALAVFEAWLEAH
ncbi:hypothetical protein V8J82_13540 [Gymnodinialimonas sp. 2305UL16-5]|uniref:hypothetical protein n=1 Tax=Gymnodinialimonas mytili TaxID=3126503 RepID=UPI00309F7FAA